MLTKSQNTRFLISVAVCEAIRELKSVPAGHLYALMMESFPDLTADQFDRFIETLVNTGLVSRKNHVLTWTGPEL